MKTITRAIILIVLMLALVPFATHAAEVNTHAAEVNADTTGANARTTEVKTRTAQIKSDNVLDVILKRYQFAAEKGSDAIKTAATWLFWTLTVISMVWTFGMMALRAADIGEFFAEFIRFTLFTGFFWWLLTNGFQFASDILASLPQVAGRAMKLDPDVSPFGVLKIGLRIFLQVLHESSIWSPIDSIFGLILALIIFCILTVIAVNMLLLLVAGWILAFAGVFFLGFGGSRWTSDIAINYYKTVLGVAAQLFGMVMVVGVGQTFLNDYYSQMSTKDITFSEMAIMLVVAIVLLQLAEKVPQLIAEICGGGGSGIGNLSAGKFLSAAATAGIAIASGGAALAAGAAGGASAVAAAASKASENVSSGSDIMSGIGGGGGGGGAVTGAVAKGARLAADTGANLAKGAGAVAKETGAAVKEAVQERIGATVGSKIASAIRSSGGTGGSSDSSSDGGHQTQTTAAQSPSSNDNSSDSQPQSAPAPTPSPENSSQAANNNAAATTTPMPEGSANSGDSHAQLPPTQSPPPENSNPTASNSSAVIDKDSEVAGFVNPPPKN